MAKRDIKRILKIKKKMGILQGFFDVDYILFLFGFKSTVMVYPEKRINKDFDLLANLYIAFSEECTRKKIYAYDFGDERGLKEFFILSHNEIDRKDLIIKNKFNHRKLGEILGYPKCCIDKFIEEYRGDRATSMSWDSAKRYLDQVKKMKIKEDPFEVKISKNGIVMDSKIYGFIPCSPKCKEALKMINNYKLIKEILNKNV